MPSSITFPPSSDALTHDHLHRLAEQIKQWGRELGFQQVGIADTDLAAHEAHLNRWLESGYHGEMAFMAKHGTKRTRPRGAGTRHTASDQRAHGLSARRSRECQSIGAAAPRLRISLCIGGVIITN